MKTSKLNSDKPGKPSMEKPLNQALVGTDGDDLLFGTKQNDIILGGLGNDTLNGEHGKDSISGDAGDDVIDGGKKNDILEGGEGSDRLLGNQGNDFLSGGLGDDSLFGGASRDNLEGGDGNDLLDGGDGKDDLFGGMGNDTLLGGNGKDMLVGSFALGAAQTTLATNEVDTLTGGRGRDIFVLGLTAEGTNAAQIFYTSTGISDYAVITDFQASDQIQLIGSDTDYVLGAYASGGTAIYIKSSGTSADLTQPGELIAVLEGVDPSVVNLNSRQFAFV
jgi:Ca2+-binding RTX toxin-like protein